MKDKERTKEQLIDELVKLRQQITELQKSEIKHRQIEESLTESEEKYRILVELIDVGIQIETVEGRILACNTAGAKIYGYTKEEMTGLTLADLVPEEFAEKLPKVITDKETTHGIFLPRISKKKDGTIFPTEIASKIINIAGKPRLIAYIRDITERKEAEKKLRKARKMFASLFNSSPEATLYHDKDGRIININSRFTELFGYTLKELKGRNIDEGMIYPTNKIEEGKILTQKAFNRFSDYKTIRKKKDGTLVHVIISTAPVIINKRPQGTIALYRDITERKKAEETLQKSQQEFVSLFDNSPQALAYLDPKSNVVNINPRFTELFGYSLEEIKGRNIDDGMIHPPDKMGEAKELTEKSLKGYFYCETVRKKKDGTLFPVAVSGSQVIIDGQLKGLIGTFEDITERKQTEQLQQVLYNISQAAISPISLDELYQSIHKELGTIIDTTNFYIALVDEKEDKVYFPYHQDEKDNNFPLINFSKSNSLTAYVIRSGQSLFLNYEKLKKMIDRKEVVPVGTITGKSIWLGTPLKMGDKTIGVMAVQSYTNPDLYIEDDIKILEFVSSQVAMAIQRKRAEEALRKSQQELASIFKNIPQAVVYLDENSNIKNISPRFTELFGYTLEEIKGRNINDGMIHPPNKIREGKNLDKKASSEGYSNYESIRKKKDSTLFPVSISGSNIIIDGQLKGIIGTYFDISKQKKLEKKLEKLAHFDILTGCYSRGYGLNLLEQQIKTANRKKTFVTLFYFDIDRFKYINDTFSHKEGDMVLKETVKLFKSTLREVDIICRIGGDEFLLILSDTSPEKAPQINKRINKNLKKLNQELAKPYKIDFSVGLSYYNPTNPLSIDELIRIADENMYKEKKKKKEGK